MSTDPLASETRKVFDALHRGQLNAAGTKDRIRGLLTHAYLRVERGWFEGKRCLDAGCGNAANGMINLFRLGAGAVWGLDVGDAFKETAARELDAAGYQGRYRLDAGSVLDLPYPEQSFDFVLCQGVLHHVSDERKAVRELYRVLKPGGRFHFTFHGAGGLFADMVHEFLRPRVAADADLLAGARQLSAAQVREQLAFLEKELEGDEGPHVEKCRALLRLLSELVDDDLMLTVKDRLLAPSYKRYSERAFRALLEQTGFTRIERVTRRPALRNLRCILAPLYEKYDHPLARLLYGDGQIQFVGSR